MSAPPTATAHPTWCAQRDCVERGEHRSRTLSATSSPEDLAIRLALAQVIHPAARPRVTIGIDGQIFDVSTSQVRVLGWLLRRIIASLHDP